MAMWVLPGILNVEDINELAPELLEKLSFVSTGVVLSHVNKFISQHSDSSNPTYAKAASKLKEAYDSVNSINEYLNSEEARNMADTLASLQFSDVRADMPMEQLVAYRTMILEVLSEDAEFVSSYDMSGVTVSNNYKCAYTPKLDETRFFEVVQDMQKFCTSNPSASAKGMELVANMQRFQSLFVNGRTKLNSATVFRKAVYHKDTLKSILKGIDFLIAEKNAGTSPRSWRYI